MKVNVTGKNFSDAKGNLFTIYGVTSAQIIDFTDNDDGTYEFEVLDTVAKKLEINKIVDDLIKSYNFTDSDTAFIGADGQVYTPKGSNLFERLKWLIVNNNTLPQAGFTNLIDANNVKFDLESKDSVVVNNLILTKEGNLLKGRMINSEYSNDLSIKIEFKPKDSSQMMILMDSLKELENKVPYSVIQG